MVHVTGMLGFAHAYSRRGRVAGTPKRKSPSFQDLRAAFPALADRHRHRSHGEAALAPEDGVVLVRRGQRRGGADAPGAAASPRG